MTESRALTAGILAHNEKKASVELEWGWGVKKYLKTSFQKKKKVFDNIRYGWFWGQDVKTQ